MRHPDDEEAESLISMFASQPCRFGVDCKQTGCLYFSSRAKCFSADSVNAVEWTPANGLYGNASNNRKQDPTLIPQVAQDGQDSSNSEGAHARAKSFPQRPLKRHRSWTTRRKSARRNLQKMKNQR